MGNSEFVADGSRVLKFDNLRFTGDRGAKSILF